MDSKPTSLPPPYTAPAKPRAEKPPPSLTCTIRLSTQDLEFDLQEAHLSDPPPHYESSATPRYERYARPQLRHPSCTARTNPSTENLAALPPQLQIQDHVRTGLPRSDEGGQSAPHVLNADGIENVTHDPACGYACLEQEETWAELFAWRKRTKVLATLCVVVVVLMAGLAFASSRCGLLGGGGWF